MSEPAPSDSAASPAPDPVAAELPLLLGGELVEISRGDGPIYLPPELRWGGAGYDEQAYGLPLDRVFGEAGEVYVTGMLDPQEAQNLAGAGQVEVDPVVTIAGLAEGGVMLALDALAPLAGDDAGMLPGLRAETIHASAIDPVFAFDAELASLAHWHEAWSWDSARGGWVFDPQV
ncbi:MAG: hypothetical protein FJX02_01975 [Alphaproteobacteria bacterium]|nr:hypothetical protein [Alphaproteobacteria bacterium]